MLANMKAKLDASRSLLYETCRFVDIYKSLDRISKVRTLTPDERSEMKFYQRLADVYTPLLKGMVSEYCNQLAYDAIQIYGGSGFMKDYPVERIYRDARITSIYEGTTQLQVVAAIRGVSTGVYLKQIREMYEKVFDETVRPELHKFYDMLLKMTCEYEICVTKVTEAKNNEYLDFHSRRLVEMAGNIIMSYLLVWDGQRDEHYVKSTEIFIKHAEADNKHKKHYIESVNPEDLGFFKDF
jgi:hypothetical protein